MADYTYDLPNYRIASHPLPDRDASKLLIYDKGEIRESVYRQLADEIPPGSLLILNDTRVVQARLQFFKTTGGIIEIFCLEADDRYPDITTAMAATGQVYWTCLVGGASKWKHGSVLQKSIYHDGTEYILSAALCGRKADSFTIEFTWSPNSLSFADILQEFGQTPIPPYLNRDTSETDKERYQTIYAHQDGSVAAPTAGLHFTPHVFRALKNKKVDTAFVTLHVGAGTFRPVKTARIEHHEMHAEFIDVGMDAIRLMIEKSGDIIAVGTTSLRTLESLYWMGVKISINPIVTLDELILKQWEVYEQLETHALPAKDALQHLLTWMLQHGHTRLICKTQILIVPGYQVRMVKAIITNFHQPQSTLLLLIAAVVGGNWKKIYQYALQHDFRFLSYGDGSLLWCNTN